MERSDLVRLALGVQRRGRARGGHARLEVRLPDGPPPDVVAALRVHDEEHEQGDRVRPHCGARERRGQTRGGRRGGRDARGSQPRKPNAAEAEVSLQTVRAAAGVQALH